MTFLFGAISVSRADVIAYTDLGNNDAYAYPNFTGSGTIGGMFRTEAAFQFTPTVSGDITKIRIALGTNFTVNLATVSLYADSMNYPDPSLLALTPVGIPVFDPAIPGNNPLPLTVINVTGGKRTITAGTPYWLSVSPGPPNANGDPNLLAWFDNSIGATGFYAQRTNPPRPQNQFVVFGVPGSGSPPFTLGAFEITVAVAAPEPGYLGLCFLTLFAVIFFSPPKNKVQ